LSSHDYSLLPFNFVEDCVIKVVAAVGIIATAATGILCVCLGFHKLRKRRHTVHPQIQLHQLSHGSGAQPSAPNHYTDLGSIVQTALPSQASTQEFALQNVDQQTSQQNDHTAPNSAAGCSTSHDLSQGTPTSQTPTQEHAPISFDGQTSESEDLIRTNSSENKNSGDVNSMEPDDDATFLENEVHLPQRSKSWPLSFTSHQKGTDPPAEMQRLLSSPRP